MKISTTTAYRVASLLANNLALVSTMTKIENHNSRQRRGYLASFFNMSVVLASLAKFMDYIDAYFPAAAAWPPQLAL